MQLPQLRFLGSLSGLTIRVDLRAVLANIALPYESGTQTPA
jgi:hypothetical protein